MCAWRPLYRGRVFAAPAGLREHPTADQLHVVRFSGVGRCSLGVAYRARCPSRFACCVLARINALNSITPMPGCSCPACPVATYPMAIMVCELRELRGAALAFCVLELRCCCA